MGVVPKGGDVEDIPRDQRGRVGRERAHVVEIQRVLDDTDDRAPQSQWAGERLEVDEGAEPGLDKTVVRVDCFSTEINI